MTLQALPKQPEAWRPSPGYSAAALREQSEAKALGAINDAAEDYWTQFWHDCDALMLMEYPTPPPAQRLVRWQNKPTQELPPVPPAPMVTDDKGTVEMIEQAQPPLTGSWFGQKIDFPKDYEADMQDWVQLEPVSMRRDQVLREVAGLEMMALAQQQMTAPPALPAPEPATSGVVEKLPDIGWPTT